MRHRVLVEMICDETSKKMHRSVRSWTALLADHDNDKVDETQIVNVFWNYYVEHQRCESNGP